MITKIIKHSDTSIEVLEKIANIKSLRWPYTLSQHLDWFKLNIKPDDLHLLIYDDNEIVAYMNLVSVEMEVNNKLQKALGIGNVCTSESGKGLGNILMQEVNEYLLLNNICGLLFCKDNLVSYYQKNKWILVDKINLNGISNQINTMIFNIDTQEFNIKYSDRNF